MKPSIRVVLDAQQIAELLQRLKRRELTPQDYQFLEGMVDTWQFLCLALEKKRLSIKRLQRLLFGPSSESSEKLLKGQSNRANKQGGKPKRKGHGRNGASSYWGAKRIQVPHTSLKVGDRCVQCGKGKLYELKTPSRIVVFQGQAPLKATVYECQRLRCCACGTVFVAEAPAEAKGPKYDSTAGSIVALLKYGNGMPFYRLEQLQKSLGVPLAASVQWLLVEQKAQMLIPVWEQLIREAAQGQVLNNDDTSMTILQLLKDRSKAFEHTDEQPKNRGAPERTGVFTTAILSSGEQRHAIALFHSGVKHAGENLENLLKHRQPDRPSPILMCDALSRNLPKSFAVILANCLAHARRQFVDLVEAFPAECEYILKSLKQVYINDEKTKSLGLSAVQRLAYHQSRSESLMEELHTWGESQFEQKKVEPNSSLGDAISYMLDHWNALTQFLRVPGAPLDNNLCERALKRAILHRKNAMFYKTLHGAKVGDILMSIIYTCILCKANPFEYLTVTEKHESQVSENPQSWMPWNYRDQIEAVKEAPLPA